MARIRGRGNATTELAFVVLLKTARLSGWRRHPLLPLSDRTAAHRCSLAAGRRFAVRPDFVFRAAKVAVFVDGCFWHSCPLHATPPKANEAYWAAKLARNRARDRYVADALRRRGWRVMRVWEHDIKAGPKVMRRLVRFLTPPAGEGNLPPRRIHPACGSPRRKGFGHGHVRAISVVGGPSRAG